MQIGLLTEEELQDCIANEFNPVSGSRLAMLALEVCNAMR